MAEVSTSGTPLLTLGRQRRKPRIDIIPLVDVLTILIFFFVTSMQFHDVRSLDITMPQMDTAGTGTLEEGLLIRLSADGEIFLGREGHSVDRDGLVSFLSRMEGTGRYVSVRLMADEEAPLREVAFIMDECRRVGLDRIRLQSR
ncbi:MAG: biopolymer transporter ExbD [Opitutales bacterium]|nr:biopolymer transporter ExbD [Opitutales bacterium]